MECLSPRYIHKQDIVVPCGVCPFCAVTRRSDWSFRLHYEAKKHEQSHFLTLTYSNNNLTYDYGHPQLVKSDLQNFFKRLRKKGHKCRYFAVGEYGSKTYRPHYHIILFGNVPRNVIEKSWARFNKRNQKYYAIGHVHFGKVTEQSVMYCLGYLVNARTWKMKHHRVPPFTTMSRRPGLGANYLTKSMIEWHKSDRKNYVIQDGQKKHLPRYYKNKIFSKIDLVRISVRTQKELFQQMVKKIRSPAMRKMKDPLKYINEQRKNTARKIRAASKQNLII
ncbi:MAG: replication initiator protein [Microviridae sp.]|nr:MAG: replication initiator protein [Microviridae sp.]